VPEPSSPNPSPPPCPICGKPVPDGPEAKRVRPFCSTRCADVDLGRWFGGAYAIPGPPPELDEDPPESSLVVRS
jgi:endogenous inhibitor of DNA gyrase (YacG/DUF329 family)